MEKLPRNNKMANRAKALSILVARDGLSFCVSENDMVKHFSEKKFPAPQNPENLLEKIQAFFAYSFKEELPAIGMLNVFFASPLYAVVPRPYFNEKNLGDYLKFNVKLLPTDELSFDELNTTEANLVYVPYTNITNYLFEKFGEFTYQHAVSTFIEQCKTKLKNEGTVAFANVFSTHFDLCVFTNGELLLCNSYDYFSPEDFAYYALFAFQELKLDTETTELKLCGSLEKNSRVFQLLYTYVRHVSFMEPTNRIKIEDPTLGQSEPHKHQFLLNTLT